MGVAEFAAYLPGESDFVEFKRGVSQDELQNTAVARCWWPSAVRSVGLPASTMISLLVGMVRMQRRLGRARRDRIDGRAQTLGTSLRTDARCLADQNRVIAFGPLRLEHIGHDVNQRPTSDDPAGRRASAGAVAPIGDLPEKPVGLKR